MIQLYLYLEFKGLKNAKSFSKMFKNHLATLKAKNEEIKNNENARKRKVAKKQIWLEIKEQFLCFMFEIKIYNTFISYQKLWLK